MRRNIVIFCLILSSAFVLRLASAIWWHSQTDATSLGFRFGDSHSYWVIASKIARGLSFEYGGPESKIFRAPLYPLFLAPFTLFSNPWHGVFAARVAGCILGTLNVALVMWASRRLFGWQAAWWAGGLATLYPGAIGMSVFVLSEALCCTWILLAIEFWSRVASSMDCGPVLYTETKMNRMHWSGWAILSGVVSGLACLTRPSWLLWPVILLIASLMLCHKRRPLVFAWICMSASIVVVLCPWWYRNYLVTDRFVPTTLQVGASLYDGLHAGASGASDEDMQFVNQFIEQQKLIDAENASNLESTFEYRLDRSMHRAALDWSRENPSDVVRLAMLKFARTWNPLPKATQVGSQVVRWSEAIAYCVILLVSVLGIWRLRPAGLAVWTYAFPTIYFALLHMIFVGSVRYRQPAILALCVVAGGVIACCISRKKVERVRDAVLH